MSEERGSGGERGRRDSAVIYGRLEPMEAAAPNLRRMMLPPGCGHWTQQERPQDVNDELVRFFRRKFSARIVKHRRGPAPVCRGRG
jgi:hypothetical protein